MDVKRFLLVAMLMVGLVGCGRQDSPDEHIEKARDFLEAGQLQSAALELKNALRLDGASPGARLLLGQVYLKSGDFAAAEKELRRAHELGIVGETVMPLLARALLAQRKYSELATLPLGELSPGEEKAEVLALQAQGEAAQGRLDAAEKRISAALKVAPQLNAVRVVRARLYAVAGKDAAARALLGKVLADAPSFAPAWSLQGDLYRSQGKLAEAEKAYDRALDAQEGNTGDLLNRAMVRLARGNFDGAAKDLAVLKKRIPLEPNVNYLEGRLALEHGKLEEAKAAFERALKVQPSQLLPKYYLAVVNLRLGNLQQAESYAEKLLRRFPDAVISRELVGVVKLRQGDFRGVQSLVEPVVRQYPDRVRATAVLAGALAAQGKISEALPLFKRLVALQPKSGGAELKLGLALLQAGHMEKAMPHLRAALKKDPGLSIAHLYLVQIAIRADDLQAAAKEAERYRQVEPERPEPWIATALVDLARHDEVAAEKDLAKARKLAPGHPAVNTLLARLFLKRKEPEKARVAYQEILQYHGNDLPTLVRLALLDASEGKGELVVKHLERAISTHPESMLPRLMLARYYLLDQQPERVASALTGLAQSRQQAPAILKVRARALLAQKKLEEAGYLIKQLLAQRPADAEAHLLMARLFLNKGDIQGAKPELKQILARDEKHVAAHLLLARIAVREGDRDAAERHVAFLRQRAPDDPVVLQLEAGLAELKGNLARAEALLAKVNQTSGTTDTITAQAQLALMQGEEKKALDIQQSWLREHPQDIQAAFGLARTLAKIGEAEKAAKQLSEMVEKAPHDPMVLNDAAWNMRKSNPSRALELAQKAQQLAPESAAILDTLAMVQLANGKLEQAGRAIDRALTKDPSNTTYLYHKALVAWKRGEDTKARGILQELLNQSRDFPAKAKARELLGSLSK